MSPKCFHPDSKDIVNEAANSWCHRCYKKNNLHNSGIHAAFANEAVEKKMRGTWTV
jgi:hypothetical protein